MRIGILLPTIFTSKRYGAGRIFAPGDLAIALADGLVAKGHQVRLYTSKDVVSKAQIVAGDTNLTERELSYYQFRFRDEAERKYTTAEIVKRDFEYGLTLAAYEDAKKGELDLIHSFHDFGAHYFNELTGFPTVYTLHDPLPQADNTIEFHRFSRFAHHAYVAISNSQRRGAVALNFVATIYHGLDLSAYEFQPKAENHLVHFGRVMADKGTDVAIAAAKKAGVPLVIATSEIRANRSQEFFDTKITPFVDDKTVKLVGFMEGKEKSAYIGSGKAFLFPLAWEEPFGMAMIEAMACGTPVIAYNRGSVSELIRDGVTGFIVDPDGEDRPGISKWIIKEQGVAGLVAAIARIGEIDREACRRHVEERFTNERMVSDYEKAYESILTR